LVSVYILLSMRLLCLNNVSDQIIKIAAGFSKVFVEEENEVYKEALSSAGIAYEIDLTNLVPVVKAHGASIEFVEDVIAVGFVDSTADVESLTKIANYAGRGITVIVDEEDLKDLQTRQNQVYSKYARQRLLSKSLNFVAKRLAEISMLMSRGDEAVIVVGSGGREHALAATVARSSFVSKVIVAPGNGGIATSKNCKIIGAPDVKSNDFDAIVKLARDNKAALVIVGPEQPLVDGLADRLEREGLKCFGPSQAAAQLENSKAWSKDFMQRHSIPTAKYKTFKDVTKATTYVKSLSHRVVIKASGLAAGKGVIIPADIVEAVDAIEEIMAGKFGEAGEECVVEEFLEGEEVSVLAFTDGNSVAIMPGAQDHKRVGEGDNGLNTGGMGAYAPAPILASDLVLTAKCKDILQRTVDAMESEGRQYIGILYTGFMIVKGEPVVLEYNVRFGDPEAQVLLPLLDTDLFEIMLSCCNMDLHNCSIKWKNIVATTVVCAAPGYPGSYIKDAPISLPTSDADTDVQIFHAGTKLDENGILRTNGGRVLAVTGTGKSLRDALESSYVTLSDVNFEGMHYRRDIAHSALTMPIRVGILGSTRGTDIDALVAAVQDNTSLLYGRITLAVAVSNKKESGILDRCRGHGITVEHLPALKGESRDVYDSRLTHVLENARVDVILCIGWMRIFSGSFIQRWSRCCLNVHPSLLPDFAGAMDIDVHQAVIDAGCKETGCTVHEVTDIVDGGPIVIQSRCPVLANDTSDTVKKRVQSLEGNALVQALHLFQRGSIGPLANMGYFAIQKENATTTHTPLTYAAAGVNIDAGDALVRNIIPLVKRTRRPGSDTQLGGFGGLFDLSAAGFGRQGELLVASTDGVGTKLKIAQTMGIHDTIGIDLVAMNVNDILTSGAEPLFFLDYYATGVLDVEITTQVVAGIVEGCVQSGCALIGGETAEMASMYAPGEYDLGGFVVGAVSTENMLLSKNIGPGDMLIGLSSSGVHSNGFSLVRKCVERSGLTWEDPCPWDSENTLGRNLLCPTRIYVKTLLPLIQDGLLKGAAHITGGGIMDNLPRILPEATRAFINIAKAGWSLPPVFKWLQMHAQLPKEELARTFNCGIGMVLCVDATNADNVLDRLRASGDKPLVLGTIIAGTELPVVNLVGELV